VPNFFKKKKKLVIDGDVTYWEVDGKRLSNEEAKRLLEEIDNEYFENSNDDNKIEKNTKSQPEIN